MSQQPNQQQTVTYTQVQIQQMIEQARREGERTALQRATQQPAQVISPHERAKTNADTILRKIEDAEKQCERTIREAMQEVYTQFKTVAQLAGSEEPMPERILPVTCPLEKQIEFKVKDAAEVLQEAGIRLKMPAGEVTKGSFKSASYKRAKGYDMIKQALKYFSRYEAPRESMDTGN